MSSLQTLFGQTVAKSPTAAVIASVLLSGGGAGAVVNEILDREAAALREHIAQLEEQLTVAQSAQAALRGQNCEHLRALGAIREDADCWGMER